MPKRRHGPVISEVLSSELLAETGFARRWAADAICAGADPELFFPPTDRAATEARRICSACPVQGPCLAYAVTADEPFGIWGGLDTDERQAMRRELKRRGELPPPDAVGAA